MTQAPETQDEGSLAGRGAVITGGGRGIGAATARALAADGAHVVVSARSEDQIRAIADELQDAGHHAWAIPCDVADPDSVRALAAAARNHLGKIEILVNNAGIATSAPVHKLTLEDWNRVMAVNATGTFLCTQAMSGDMVKQGWGRIVNVASIAGKTGAPYIAAYAASKHAVLGFTRAMAAELAPTGVTANAVCPGYVETDMVGQAVANIVEKTGASQDQAKASIEATNPQGRILQSEEVAALIRFLCQPEAGGIHGQALVQDGGGLLV